MRAICQIPTASVPDRDLLIDPRVTLSACHELRELEFEISANPLNEMELDFISSVASTNIEKIIINRSAELDHPVGDDFWTQLDDVLAELAERRECKLVRLEVEFWGNWGVVGGMERDQKMAFLPKFVEKGGMIFWVCWNSHPICCPDTMNTVGRDSEGGSDDGNDRACAAAPGTMTSSQIPPRPRKKRGFALLRLVTSRLKAFP